MHHLTMLTLKRLLCRYRRCCQLRFGLLWSHMSRCCTRRWCRRWWRGLSSIVELSDRCVAFEHLPWIWRSLSDQLSSFFVSSFSQFFTSANKQLCKQDKKTKQTHYLKYGFYSLSFVRKKEQIEQFYSWQDQINSFSIFWAVQDNKIKMSSRIV